LCRIMGKKKRERITTKNIERDQCRQATTPNENEKKETYGEKRDEKLYINTRGKGELGNPKTGKDGGSHETRYR